jgi:hypothetical protein
MSEYKEVYQNLMNIMNSIQRIQKIQMSALTNPLTTDIIMNGYNILECNNIIANTLTSSNINTNALLTNSITSNYQSGIKINSNYPNNSGTFPLLTVTGQTTGSLTYPNNDIFKVNNDGSVIIGSYGRLITNSTVPALTVYGSIELHGPLNSTNIVSSIIGDADNGPGAITVSGTYAYKTVALANTINNINITTGAISNLYTNSSTISSLFASSGTIGNLYSNAGSISSLYVNSCSNINTNINSSTISNLISTNGTISNININSGTVSNLNSTDSKINNLYTNSYSLSNLFGNSGTINNLQSKNATISSLFTNNGSFGNLYSNSSSIASLNTTNCTSTNIFCNSSSIGNLVSNYGTISSLYTSNLKLINLQSTPINYVIGVDGQGNINSQAVPSLNGITNVTTGTTYSLGYIPNITGSTLNVNTPNQNLNSNSITANFNGLFLTLNTTIEYPYTITGGTFPQTLISSNNISYDISLPPAFYPAETLTIKNNITYNKIGNIIYWKCNLILSTTRLIEGNQISYYFINSSYFILPFKYSSSLTSPILNNPTNITSLIQLCNLHRIDTVVNNVRYDGYTTSTGNIPLSLLGPNGMQTQPINFSLTYNNLFINGSDTGVIILAPQNGFPWLNVSNNVYTNPIPSAPFTVTLNFSGSYYTTS